jgi:hypothetical protein
LIYWLVRVLAPSSADLRWLAPAAVFIIWTQFLVGALQWFAPGMLPNAWLGRVGERTTGTFGNPGVFTTTLMFCAVVLIQYAALNPRRLARWIAYLSIGVALFAVLWSFSRGSWLGYAGCDLGAVLCVPQEDVQHCGGWRHRADHPGGGRVLVLL